MTTEKRLAVVFGPEGKRWVRIIDGVLVLCAAAGIGAVLLFAPVKIEPAALRYAFLGALVSLPLVAWMLFRETTINRLERIAILLLVLATGFALLYIGFEQSAAA